MIPFYLEQSEFHLSNENYFLAVRYLQMARNEAKQGTRQKDKALAAHCTVAMQALFPFLVADTMHLA